MIDPKTGTDDLEPDNRPYDWYEALRQNPDQSEMDWPQEADDAAGRLLADQVEEFAAGNSPGGAQENEAPE